MFLNRRLLQSQTRYQEFFDDSPVALIVINSEHRIIEWNQTAETIFGWEKLELKGEELIDMIVADFDKIHFALTLHKASRDGSSQSKNYNMHKHGHEIFCEWRNCLLEGGKGEILCMAQDITQSQKTIDELNKRSFALESAGDAIFYTNEKGIIEFANPSFFALGLEKSDQICGTHIGTYLFKNRLAFTAIKSEFDENHIWKGTVTKNSENGEKVFSVTITAVYHRDRLVSYIANLHDITKISSHVDALIHCSQHDPLTGATNRKTMNEKLDQAILNAQRNKGLVALYFIDLNDFKLVNDRYGHEAGDRLLMEVASNLRACLRNTDTISRYGGDEFVIIVENIKGEEHIQTIREAIETAISEPVRIDSQLSIRPKASIGIARYPYDAANRTDLIKAADQSMYHQKKLKPLNEPGQALSAGSRNH